MDCMHLFQPPPPWWWRDLTGCFAMSAEGRLWVMQLSGHESTGLLGFSMKVPLIPQRLCASWWSLNADSALLQSQREWSAWCVLVEYWASWVLGDRIVHFPGTVLQHVLHISFSLVIQPHLKCTENACLFFQKDLYVHFPFLPLMPRTMFQNTHSSHSSKVHTSLGLSFSPFLTLEPHHFGLVLLYTPNVKKIASWEIILCMRRGSCLLQAMICGLGAPSLLAFKERGRLILTLSYVWRYNGTL